MDEPETISDDEWEPIREQLDSGSGTEAQWTRALQHHKREQS